MVYKYFIESFGGCNRLLNFRFISVGRNFTHGISLVHGANINGVIYDVFSRWYISIVVSTLALGSRPKQGLAKVWAKNEAWESHSMLLGVWESVKEWTLHTPKWTPTLRVGVPMDSQIFREQFQGSKPIRLKRSLY